MHPIPISENAIRPHIGRPVCAVLRDGSCFYGTIADIRDGQLILSGGSRGHAPMTTSAKKKKKQASKNKANVSGYYPSPGYPYGYGAAIAVPLFLLALLFSVPFFGFPFY